MAEEKRPEQMVIAFFEDEPSAHVAVDALKQWDKDRMEIELGQIGILVKDENGKIKEELLGPREGTKGVGVGMVLGAVAAIASGPIGWGALIVTGAAGGVIGHFIPKGLGGERRAAKEGIAELSSLLENGSAIVAVFAPVDQAGVVLQQLEDLGGKVQAHEVSEEALQAFAASAEEQAAAITAREKMVAAVTAPEATDEAVPPPES